MFGFWFWILTPLVLIMVVAFVYDRRHDGVRIEPPQEAPEPPPGAGGPPTGAGGGFFPGL